MYVSKKDIDTIAELAAFVDGAVESADGLDENGNDIAEYWKELSVRVNKLQAKIKNQHKRQSFYKINNKLDI